MKSNPPVQNLKPPTPHPPLREGLEATGYESGVMTLMSIHSNYLPSLLLLLLLLL